MDKDPLLHKCRLVLINVRVLTTMDRLSLTACTPLRLQMTPTSARTTSVHQPSSSHRWHTPDVCKYMYQRSYTNNAWARG